MVKSYNGEVFFIPKEFEEEIRADEREKCKCPYWNEEHRECATSFEEDIRANERAKVINEVDTIIDFINYTIFFSCRKFIFQFKNLFFHLFICFITIFSVRSNSHKSVHSCKRF